MTRASKTPETKLAQIQNIKQGNKMNFLKSLNPNIEAIKKVLERDVENTPLLREVALLEQQILELQYNKSVLETQIEGKENPITLPDLNEKYKEVITMPYSKDAFRDCLNKYPDEFISIMLKKSTSTLLIKNFVPGRVLEGDSTEYIKHYNQNKISHSGAAYTDFTLYDSQGYGSGVLNTKDQDPLYNPQTSIEVGLCEGNWKVYYIIVKGIKYEFTYDEESK